MAAVGRSLAKSLPAFEGEVLIRKDGYGGDRSPRKDLSALWAKLDAIGGREQFPDRPEQGEWRDLPSFDAPVAR